MTMEWYIILSVIVSIHEQITNIYSQVIIQACFIPLVIVLAIGILSFFLLHVCRLFSLDCCTGDEDAAYQAPVPFTLSVSQDQRAGFDPYNNERLDQSDVGV